MIECCLLYSEHYGSAVYLYNAEYRFITLTLGRESCVRARLWYNIVLDTGGIDLYIGRVVLPTLRVCCEDIDRLLDIMEEILSKSFVEVCWEW